MEKIPMTPDGLKRLEEELKHLKTVERPNIIKAISEAREHGDLSENAEYHAARERQSFCEGRIEELEDVTSRAEVIEIANFTGDESVKFGAHVTIADEDTDEETTYQVVGPHEADINSGRISTTSPIGRSLIGKAVGDSVEVSTPRGSKSYEIIAVEYK